MAGIGPVSSLAPTCRLFALLVLSTALFLMSPLAAALISIALAILLKMEGIGCIRLLRESVFLLWMAAFAFLIQGFDFSNGIRPNHDGLIVAAGYGTRLLAAFWAGRLFYAATSRVELRDAATGAVRRIPGRARSDAGLALFLVLGFIPLIVEEWKASLEAATSRALPKRPGLSKSAALLAAFLRRLMLMSLEIPDALRARAWSTDRPLRLRRWRLREYLVCACSCAVLAYSCIHPV